MSNSKITFGEGQFDRLFPFHIRLDAQMKILAAGRSLQKIAPDIAGNAFIEVFKILRPSFIQPDFQSLSSMDGEMVVFELLGFQQVVFRGAFETIDDGQGLLFVGSPWFGSMDLVRDLGLGLSDFAIHDPMIDLLHVVKTQEIANNDVKDLLGTVNRQKNTLKKDQIELQRLSLVAKTNRHGVVFTDLAGNITWCNEGFCDLTGFSVAESIGKTPIQLLRGPLTDREQLKLMVSNYEKGLSVDLELHFYQKDGSWFWGNIKNQPLKNQQGDITEFYAIIEDIHDRKLAEEELQKSESRLSAVIRNMLTGVILENEDRKIVLVNQEFCDLFAIPAPPAALIGADCANSAEESKGLFKDPEAFVARIEVLLKNRLPVVGDVLHLKDGRVLERAYIPVFEADQYRGHLWRYEDITERETYARTLRLQEEKYRNIITNMNLGLVEVDLKERAHFANQSFLDMSGYSFAELEGNSPSALLLMDEGKQEMMKRNATRSEGIADMYEIPIHNKHGDLRWWMISGAPNYDDEGNLIGSIGIHLDITAQKVMEQELSIAKAKAEESSRAKEAFLANMSHEIRTPLNAIIGVFRELTRANLDHAHANYLENAQTAAHHLLAIINNILDMSKIEAGELKLEKEALSIRAAIESSLAIVQVSAEKKGLLLHSNISSEVREAYLGDDMRIRQVLLNLLGNAIKFTEKGTVTVTCEVEGTFDAGHRLRILVTDTGVGMDEAFLENIFTKFSQEDGSTARRYGGTGLGMAISRELVQMMGGQIHASSKLGEGTQFELLIPLSYGDVAAIATDALANQEDFTNLRGKRILLAEDNPMNRMVAMASLEHFGLQVVEAENGLIAVNRMIEQQFDLVLMDVQMPEMDGLDATKEIRKFDQKTPIVALSANAFKREVDQCLAEGMNAYVTKPFDELLLMQTIQRLIVQAAVQVQPATRPEPTNEAVYELSKIRAIARGNEEFVKKMVEIFLEETPPAFVKLQEALDSGDFDFMKRVAHRIKPSMEAMGMMALHGEIKEIELGASSGMDAALLMTHLEAAQRYLEAVIAQLQRDFA